MVLHRLLSGLVSSQSQTDSPSFPSSKAKESREIRGLQVVPSRVPAYPASIRLLAPNAIHCCYPLSRSTKKDYLVDSENKIIQPLRFSEKHRDIISDGCIQTSTHHSAFFSPNN